GKTSTILMGVDAYVAAHPADEIIVCAYNKAIADEVKEKLRERGHTDFRKVSAATAHSLGLSAIKFLFKPEVDDKKVRKIVDGLTAGMNSPENRTVYQQYAAQIISLVRFAKQAGFGFFSDCAISNTAAWHRLADHFDVNGLDDTSEADAVVAAAQHVYRLSLEQTGVVDFDDMILFPLVKNVRVKFTKDLIFVDEAQDLSRARQALIRKFLSPRGRMIIVGDDRQAIYGFSGADAAAIDNQVEQFGARVLPLSVTWRCPRKVVELARTLVPDIEAAPTAPEGEVLHIPLATQPPQAADGRPQAPVPWYADGYRPQPTDAILCRNTAPLVSLAYQLIRAKVPCKVEGRVIGDGLKALAQRWKVSTIDALLKRLDAYAERERQKALAKGNEAKAEEVGDRVATLREICGACAGQGRHAVADVVAFIDDLFADGAENVTVLATYHRSKGREWTRVFLLEHAARCPSRAARQEWQRQQEANLAYVAYTRAKKTLAFV
ncbi:MAG: AAA family ATPase, partial [Phycisphaerales bacterium]|nr:AAA family ATPase [Phycisphaerales bacterium]